MEKGPNDDLYCCLGRLLQNFYFFKKKLAFKNTVWPLDGRPHNARIMASIPEWRWLFLKIIYIYIYLVYVNKYDSHSSGAASIDIFLGLSNFWWSIHANLANIVCKKNGLVYATQCGGPHKQVPYAVTVGGPISSYRRSFIDGSEGSSLRDGMGEGSGLWSVDV